VKGGSTPLSITSTSLLLLVVVEVMAVTLRAAFPKLKFLSLFFDILSSPFIFPITTGAGTEFPREVPSSRLPSSIDALLCDRKVSKLSNSLMIFSSVLFVVLSGSSFVPPVLTVELSLFPGVACRCCCCCCCLSVMRVFDDVLVVVFVGEVEVLLSCCCCFKLSSGTGFLEVRVLGLDSPDNLFALRQTFSSTSELPPVLPPVPPVVGCLGREEGERLLGVVLLDGDESDGLRVDVERDEERVLFVKVCEDDTFSFVSLDFFPALAVIELDELVLIVFLLLVSPEVPLIKFASTPLPLCLLLVHLSPLRLVLMGDDDLNWLLLVELWLCALDVNRASLCPPVVVTPAAPISFIKTLPTSNFSLGIPPTGFPIRVIFTSVVVIGIVVPESDDVFTVLTTDDSLLPISPPSVLLIVLLSLIALVDREDEELIWTDVDDILLIVLLDIDDVLKSACWKFLRNAATLLFSYSAASSADSFRSPFEAETTDVEMVVPVSLTFSSPPPPPPPLVVTVVVVCRLLETTPFVIFLFFI